MFPMTILKESRVGGKSSDAQGIVCAKAWSAEQGCPWNHEQRDVRGSLCFK